MTLGQLKTSLQKFPPDMNEMEVMIQFAKNGKDDYELVCFVGYLPIPDKEYIALGTWSAMDKLIKEGKVEKPDNYIEYPNNE